MSTDNYQFGSPSSETSRSFSRKHLSVLILFFINLINYMDRVTIAGLLGDIQHKYGISDASAGMLQTVFVISYMIMAPIFGYLGDRYSRKLIMAAGILFWSTTTLIGSLPPSNFAVFALFRALVGTGEASYSTIAPTVIGDLFTNDERSKALAVFYFAIPVGSGLGYIVGSATAKAMGAWYWGLRVTPIFGVIAVFLVIFVLEDPPRGAADTAADSPTVVRSNRPFIQDLKDLTANRSYVWSTLGFTCVTFATGALALWAPLYMIRAIRVHEGVMPDTVRINLIFGGITCLAGIVGIVTGASLSQYLRRYTQRADPLICGSGMAVGVPLLFCGSLVADTSPNAAWVLFFFGITAICLNWSIVSDMLLYTIIPPVRATATAVQILASHALGDAASPYIVGLIATAIWDDDSDHLKMYKALQYALYLPVLMLVVGVVFFCLNSMSIKDDKERCSALMSLSDPNTHVCNDQSLPNMVDNVSNGSSSTAQGSRAGRLLI